MPPVYVVQHLRGCWDTAKRRRLVGILSPGTTESRPTGGPKSYLVVLILAGLGCAKKVDDSCHFLPGQSFPAMSTSVNLPRPVHLEDETDSARHST